ncbi:hypothetical protein M0R45_036789 [Rubus argutus]|uniref:Retrovirus-related Pol polyprotein from transposon TNT 1-94-like beta-barrel domain-containing protein n=1 Tax=Rubus argutus TaxID=59490 RepID=A0AAW1W0P0_RUBAR
MCPNRNWFSSYKSVKEGLVRSVGAQTYKVVGVRSIKIKVPNGLVKTLENVRHIPSLDRNLIALGTLDFEGHKIVGQDGNLKVVKGAFVVMKSKKVKGLYHLEGSFVRGGTVGSVKSQIEGGKIVNLGFYSHCEEMSNNQCGGMKFTSKMVKFEEQPTLQQSLNGGRPIRILTQLFKGGDILAHAYSKLEISPTLESVCDKKIEKQTWYSKSDASREGTVDEKGVFKRDVARVKLCKPLKITHIRFGNFSGDLDCMQVAA